MDSNDTQQSPVKTRKSAGGDSLKRTTSCFFCNKDDTSERLHLAQTLAIDKRVREYAHTLQDRILLAKLSEGDMHALDARYHLSCLTSLHNRVRQHTTEKNDQGPSRTVEGLVLGELISYTEEYRNDETLPVFKLSDIRRLYQSRPQELDPSFCGKVNATRLKERLLAMIPDLSAHSQGREVVLVFNTDIGEAIRIACAHNADDDAIHLVRTAQIVRKEILSTSYAFEGFFPPVCENDVVPQGLLALIRMILQGPSIQDQKKTNTAMLKIALALSQLIMFNMKKSTKETAGQCIRQTKVRETPLAIYTSLLIHTKTRQKELIDQLYDHGLCISYDRTMEITTGLANGACEQFEREGCVCPSTLKTGLFTVGAVDNIDHNPSSRAAKDSFHGTAISMSQFPLEDNIGINRPAISVKANSVCRRTVDPLPLEYSEVQPAVLQNSQPIVPAVDGPVRPEFTLIQGSKKKENSWLRMLEVLLDKKTLVKDDFVSWAAYHASQQPLQTQNVSATALLPLFVEKSHSVAMILHAMNVVWKATQHLNRGQIPVITMDQPLYSLAKQIQWNWPETHGENKYLVMMGGFHIEMNVMKVLGDLLKGSAL